MRDVFGRKRKLRRPLLTGEYDGRRWPSRHPNNKSSKCGIISCLAIYIDSLSLDGYLSRLDFSVSSRDNSRSRKPCLRWTASQVMHTLNSDPSHYFPLTESNAVLSYHLELFDHVLLIPNSFAGIWRGNLRLSDVAASWRKNFGH